MSAATDEIDLEPTVVELLNRWPSAGVAVGVVRDGRLDWFSGHGIANVDSGEPITPDTVFRVGSITKTVTAVAVMQLWERGLIDLDAPANDYLRPWRLVPADASLRPATVRHLLTHTAGVGYWRRLEDVLQPGVGSGIRAGRSVPSVPDFYRRGLPVEIEPGTRWVYSNHGFAALGQIVEDVTGEPLQGYLRDRVLGPLGMEHSDLVRSERVAADLATGYVLRRRGLKEVADRGIVAVGGGAMYSTVADLARYLAALLGGYAGDQCPVLKPSTVKTMFESHFQPHQRLPGMGLGFECGDESGRRTAGKGGTVSGFLSAIVMAPDDGVGVIVLTNTGGLDNRGVAEPLARAVLRRLLNLPDRTIRDDIAVRPAEWARICGWYSPDAGPVTNLFARALMGAGVEVTVRRDQLIMRPLTPAAPRGLPLHPDDPDDPFVFRVEFPQYGGDLRVAFEVDSAQDGKARRLFVDLISFQRRPDGLNPRRWLQGAALACATTAILRRRG